MTSVAQGEHHEKMERIGDMILPWDRFRDWVHSIVVVTFDLELGQTIELIYPRWQKMAEEEKTNICYLAFPDSNSGCMGDTRFHFRIRHTPTKMDIVGAKFSRHYNQKCPAALQIDQNFMFGYVYFRQVKDPSLRRGYFQKSLVILSKFPYVNFFHQILGVLAPEFFKNGIESLENALYDIYQWPSPVPGQMFNLTFLGNVFEIVIPSSICVRGNGSPTASSKSDIKITQLVTSVPRVVINSVHESDLFQYLRPILSHINLLWELVLTAEPIVVMAPVPDLCASTVNTLISVIFPLRYCADYRPYFTIHDTDFKEYTVKATPPPPVILGVTNPFFAKTLQHWPHIIRISGNSGSFSGKIKRVNSKLLDSQPGVYTNYKSFLQKDNNLLKKIVMGMESQRPVEVQTAILRRYLHELTESFMIPLERYVASLMPLQKNICPCKAAPVPRPFNPDDFLGTLEVSGPQLTSGVKAEWSGLYKKFFRSINFAEWYNMRYREAADKLLVLHIEAISETDVREWINGRDEVEAVDLVLRLREQISQTHLPIKLSVREKLKTHVNTILETLPEDLQIVLKSN